jgi:hypothetical protein
MTGEELIKKIQELGKEKEIIVYASGACEGIFCQMERKIDDINLNENNIVISIDVDS